MKKQLILLVMMLLPMVAMADDSGQCGENVTWMYEGATQTLTITGSGVMWDFFLDYFEDTWCTCPWYTYRLNIHKVIIEEGVSNIGNCSFFDFENLLNIIIPNSVTSIGGSAFSGCSGLTSITIPNGVTSIASGAFSDCSGLTSITIPNSVTSIGLYSFAGCSSISTLTIGRNVNTISSNAFANCQSLTDVYCIAENFPTTNDNAFSETPIEHAVLNVPSIHINAYRSTYPWSSFKYIFPTEGAHGERCAKPTISQKDGKVLFSCETEGASYVSDVKPLNYTETNNNEVTLPNLYRVTVYAQKYGYLDSPAATADIDVHGIQGDTNRDGKVTITDAVSVVNIILNNGETAAPALENPEVVEPE